MSECRFTPNRYQEFIRCSDVLSERVHLVHFSGSEVQVSMIIPLNELQTK